MVGGEDAREKDDEVAQVLDAEGEPAEGHLVQVRAVLRNFLKVKNRRECKCCLQYKKADCSEKTHQVRGHSSVVLCQEPPLRPGESLKSITNSQ